MDEKLGMARINTPACPNCHQSGTILVQMDDFLKWREGTLIQNAFPTLSADLREQLMTGIHPKCWDEIFPPEEVEEFGEDEMYPIHQGEGGTHQRGMGCGEDGSRSHC